MSFRKSTYLLSALFIAAFLAACGGGGGGSSDDDPVADDSIDASMRGNAVKGIVIRGAVAASELDDSGAVLRNVGNAVTGADGGYRLSLENNYRGGPVLLEVTTGPDTTMVCDAPAGCGTRTDGLTSADDPDNNDDGVIDFGEEFKPASLSITALLPDAEDGETIETQLTPFTHMAAQRALAGTRLNARRIDNANSEVSNLLGGLDILRVRPVDITNPASLARARAGAIAYAALNAALVELANDDANGQPDLVQALADLATGFAGGRFSAALLQQILNQAGATLASVGAVDTSGVIGAMQASIDDANANSGGIIDPQPGPNPGAANVALAKAFISDLRTWGTVIGDELEAPSEAFDAQIDLARQVADMDDDPASESIEAVIDAIMDFMDGTLVGPDMTNHVVEAGTFISGNITQATVADGIEYMVTNAQLSTPAGTASVEAFVIAPEDDVQTSRVVLGVRSLNAMGADTRWTIDGGLVTADLSQPYTVDYDLPELPNAFIDVVHFDLDVARTQLTTLVNGIPAPAADPVTFSGELEFTTYTVLDSNQEIVGDLPGSVMLDGEVRNDSGDSLDFSFAVSIPNAASIMPLGPVYDLDSTYADNNAGDRLISWQKAGDSFTYRDIWRTLVFTFDPGDGSVEVEEIYDCCGSFTWTEFGPYLSIEHYIGTDFQFYENRYTSSWEVGGQGTYERTEFFHDYTMDGFVEFRLADADVEFFDETQPGIGNVGLQFAAQFDGLPEASISLTANSTAFKRGNAKLTIAYGNRRLELDASNETGTETGVLEITNQDGVKLLVDFDNLEDDDRLNDITINNRVIGTLQELDSGAVKISYIDGSFEIF